MASPAWRLRRRASVHLILQSNSLKITSFACGFGAVGVNVQNFENIDGSDCR